MPEQSLVKLILLSVEGIGCSLSTPGRFAPLTSRCKLGGATFTICAVLVVLWQLQVTCWHTALSSSSQAEDNTVVTTVDTSDARTEAHENVS